jgi:uncharacterized ion transporter superfamily protein YfcC
MRDAHRLHFQKKRVLFELACRESTSATFYEKNYPMNINKIILFVLLFCVFVFLVWGRWRYDLMAFSALAVAVVTGVVPVEEAFSGFGHPATVIIAMVLIVSRGGRSQQKYKLRIASCGYFPVK